MVKTRPQLLVALVLALPLAVTPATRAFAGPEEDCQYFWVESPRMGGNPGFHVCPPSWG